MPSTLFHLFVPFFIPSAATTTVAVIVTAASLSGGPTWCQALLYMFHMGRLIRSSKHSREIGTVITRSLQMRTQRPRVTWSRAHSLAVLQRVPEPEQSVCSSSPTAC